MRFSYKNKKENNVKKYKRTQCFTINQVLKKYGKRGSGKICPDAEIDVMIWAEDNGCNYFLGMDCEKDVLDGLTIQGYNAIEWLAENTPYYEEVLPNNIVRMCDMEPEQTGICVHDNNDGAWVGCRIKRSYEGEAWINLDSGVIIDPQKYTSNRKALNQMKVRLCELNITEKKPDNKKLVFEDALSSGQLRYNCDRELGLTGGVLTLEPGNYSIYCNED